MVKHFTLALVLLTTLLATSARAADDLDIRDWLSRPGVRAVAVEFYATWCKPCMAAMPRWAALKEKYRKQGLRVVVVNTKDPEGGCRSLGWSPDETVCDLDGHVSESLGLSGQLPAAFVWTWQGAMLVRQGHIAEVETALDRYFHDAPRVALELGAGVGPDVATAVRERLTDSGKLVVVASAEERQLLDAWRKKQASAAFDEKLQCEAGHEVPPNAVIRLSRVAQGKVAFLSLTLLDLATGCGAQVVSVPWDAEARRMAGEAAAALLAKLRQGQLEMPAGERPVTKQPFGGSKVEAAKSVETEELEETVVKFASTPAASVHLGDKMLCKSTPCQKSVPLGKQNLTMSAEDYVTRTESLNVTKATKLVDWPLQADFATLSVTCGGETVNVKVDGESMSCPLQAQRVKPGKHRVVLESACFLGVEEAFEVKRGDVKTLALTVTPRLGVVTVKAQNDAGDDLTGTALLDGQPLGEVPGSFKVPVCGKQLEVRSDGHASWSAPLKVAEGEKVRVMAGLKKGAAKFEGGADAPAGMVLIPAGTFWMGCNAARDGQCGHDVKPQHKVTLSAYYMDVTETTVAQYKACVAAGRCTRPKALQPSVHATYPSQADHPVNNVNWTQAQQYCRWRGAGYDLPTEAQWEMAARGSCEKNGSTADDPRCAVAMRTYPWGEAEPNASYAAMNGTDDPAPVGSKPAGESPYGLHDMAGNVMEWTRDWYSSDYYGDSPARDPLNSSSASARVTRGGDFTDTAVYLDGGYRFFTTPSNAFNYLGLRCVRSSR